MSAYCSCGVIQMPPSLQAVLMWACMRSERTWHSELSSSILQHFSYFLCTGVFEITLHKQLSVTVSLRKHIQSSLHKLVQGGSCVALPCLGGYSGLKKSGKVSFEWTVPLRMHLFSSPWEPGIWPHYFSALSMLTWLRPAVACNTGSHSNYGLHA